MGGVHTLPVRVYYEDTDAAGIVYYANYLRFAERGRTEMLRAVGFAHRRAMLENGTAFAVRRLCADYLLPARLDDALTVETRIVEIGAATLDLEQQVKRDASLLVVLHVQVACIGPQGRPRRIPSDLRTILKRTAETPLLP
jgi:acyl-CoA thioester hydrolase